MMNISKLVPVSNLRGIWQRETDFSDWLVGDEGLQLIADSIGIGIEDPRRESRPGDYPCDIVGHAVGDEDHIIVVENQFGKTNHDHLGKLLTYASVHSAATAIWITEEASDDHRKVIDWLNDNTPPTLNFYLAQIKAFRIDNSPVAPQLDVICRPNIQAKLKRSNDDAMLSERKIWRLEVWKEILTHIKSQNPPFSVQSATTASWSNIALGKSNIILELTLTPKRQCIGCEVRISVFWKDDAFTQLEAQKSLIENEIGRPLNWMPSAGTKLSRILLEEKIDPTDVANREKVKNWMAKYSLAFYNAFSVRVRQLKPNVSPLSSILSEDEEENHDSDT